MIIFLITRIAYEYVFDSAEIFPHARADEGVGRKSPLPAPSFGVKQVVLLGLVLNSYCDTRTFVAFLNLTFFNNLILRDTCGGYCLPLPNEDRAEFGILSFYYNVVHCVIVFFHGSDLHKRVGNGGHEEQGVLVLMFERVERFFVKFTALKPVANCKLPKSYF